MTDAVSKYVPMVIVESPFMGTDGDAYTRGTRNYNIRYARACVRDCILRGEAPYASHLLYTQPGVLNDDVPEERELGMGLGWSFLLKADKQVVYTDLGWSSGMIRGVNAAIEGADCETEFRRLGGEWSDSKLSTEYLIAASKGSDPTPLYLLADLKLDGKLVSDESGYFQVDTKQGWGVRYVHKPENDYFLFELVKGNFEIVYDVEQLKADGRVGPDFKLEDFL